MISSTEPGTLSISLTDVPVALAIKDNLVTYALLLFVLFVKLICAVECLVPPVLFEFLIFFQLRWKCATKERHLPRTREIFSSCNPFPIDRCRLCPKQLILGHPNLLKAATILVPLSVVVATR